MSCVNNSSLVYQSMTFIYQYIMGNPAPPKKRVAIVCYIKQINEIFNGWTQNPGKVHKDGQMWFSADGCTGWYLIKHHLSAKLHSISDALDILFTSPRGSGSKGKNWTSAITEKTEQMVHLWWSAFAWRETVPIPSGLIAK